MPSGFKSSCLRYVIAGVSFVSILAPATTASAVRNGAGLAIEKGKTVTVTGCLRKVQDENVFILATEDANNYELTHSRFPLKDYVNRRVAVTGTMQGQQPQDSEANEIGEKPTILFQVAKLKVIGGECR